MRADHRRHHEPLHPACYLGIEGANEVPIAHIPERLSRTKTRGASRTARMLTKWGPSPKVSSLTTIVLSTATSARVAGRNLAMSLLETANKEAS